jgi:hypothetical protein
MNEEERLRVVASSLDEMQAIALRMRELIAAQSPMDLLGYIYAQQMMTAARESERADEEPQDAAEARDQINERQFLLEYVHAVLVSSPSTEVQVLDERACAELFACVEKMMAAAMFHSMATSAGTTDGAFGANTADIEVRAKSAWILLRGNRYQVLEGEFYAFVLAPHDTALKETYGIGANDVAAGFQDMADAVRTGQMDAAQMMDKQLEAAQEYADKRAKPLKENAKDWRRNNPAAANSIDLAFQDMVRGGICNVSRHTSLPEGLLADLAFKRGEETEFFAPGPYSGTPFRALPARRRPLVQLGTDYYATDPCFVRDAGYRALLWNLLVRKPEYKKEFEARQKQMSEAAFFEILAPQLRGATVYQEIFYKDPATRQWVENDTVVLIDDVLLLVEAKSGAAATIASPSSDFGRHAQAVQDLVVKAYRQCKRFFDYLDSSEEVPLFRRAGGEYVECGRLRRREYRVMLPIGLTVEAFTPFFCHVQGTPGNRSATGKTCLHLPLN